MKNQKERGDYRIVAKAAGCSAEYVKSIFLGKREKNSRLAKKIIIAMEELQRTKKEYNKKVKQIEIE